MSRIRLLSLAALATVILWSCREDIDPDDKYKRPDWLAGKVYTQVKSDPQLSTFARCIELSGYDSIIDISGSYTVFAPTDEAFTAFFQAKSYSSPEEMPENELLRLVKYHIVQNPWSKMQLRSLDVFGWIDSNDISNNEPRGFKRETLLNEKDRKYGIEIEKESGHMYIVDTTRSDWKRRVANDVRKFAPIFFKEYFDIYKLKTSDYEFYFDRPFSSPNDLYFAGAKIVGDEVFAENGFVYHIDQVVEPLPNAYQLLESNDTEHEYTAFLDLVNQFANFNYNEGKTLDQPGAEQGLDVDSLFDLNFPQLAFNLANEKTSAPPGTPGLPGNVTIRYNHGILAPTNQAMQDFNNEFFSGSKNWGSIEEAPENIQRIIANTHMANVPVYATDIERGFYNGEKDLVHLNASDIVEKKYGSNASFIGLSKMIVPRAFKSVTGPVYLQRGYSNVMETIERTDLLPALKKPGKEYLLFVESDLNCRLDSSLVISKRYFRGEEFIEFSAFTITGTSFRKFNLTDNDLRRLILNHIGTSFPKGVARKEFIRNLAGNYLIFNNETGEVRGTAPTTNGYKGTPTQDVPRILSDQVDNGITYDIDNWYSFSATSMFLKISTNYPAFHALMKKAGFYERELDGKYNFISDSEFYTVFVPTPEALAAYQVDTLTTSELRDFLQLHFISGEIIFTDGNMPAGYYETTRIGSSSGFSTEYVSVYIEPGTDIINFPAKEGGTYLGISESSSTNDMFGRNLGEGTETIPDVVINGVIHEIDSVLIMNQLITE